LILGFAHPALVVPDLDQAADFYQRAFGFQVVGQEGWRNAPEADRATGLDGSACRGLTLKGHNCFLELLHFEAPAQQGPDPENLGAQEPGIRHLAFYVDDCRAEYERFLSLGGKPLGQPSASPSGGSAVYVRDPFGNIVELCEVARPEESLLELPGIDRLNNDGG
jgi:catechol 2,3-dioxygenase-like lactoylglutathione lyase family enzyme